MKKYFTLSLNSHKKFLTVISGYSKIYKWPFVSALKTKHHFRNDTASLRTRYLLTHALKNNHRLSDDALRLQTRFQTENRLKLKDSVLTRENLRAPAASRLRLPADVKRARLKLRVANVMEHALKLRQSADFVMAELYKLEDWDYKNPSDTSVKYRLSDLDGKTLGEMDLSSYVV